ncbi:MAG: enoyl-CoA hydratase/isomerase family protein [Ruminiclostridium sp.]|jgi:enoyl-CoA hydratase|nr:enoyl-CoA hydratase/isomerase family protein [Ruminiclostridium sp.]
MQFVKLDIQAPAAVLTIDRPDCLNALNSQVFREIAQGLEELEANDEVKVVIVTGAGEKAFAAGADISQMVHQSGKEGRELAQLTHRANFLLENMRQVTIAAVNGFALGGGCELALACDIRIAAENARFGLPEVGLGILPGGGGTQRLARIVGVGRAKEMIFTCDPIDAQEAYRIGLANHVVPREKLMEECFAMAERIASKASFAVSMAKSAVNLSMGVDMTSGCTREMDLLGLLFATEDKTEGMTAFLERRKPEFKEF